MTTKLWSDLGGTIYCPDHLGMYASAALEKRPQARRIETPITVWTRMTSAEMEPETFPASDVFDDAEPGKMMTFTPECETCGAKA